MHYSEFEAKEILTVSYGTKDDRNMLICFDAFDWDGNIHELVVDIDRVEFLRWFDKDTMNELKSLAIKNIEEL